MFRLLIVLGLLSGPAIAQTSPDSDKTPAPDAPASAGQSATVTAVKLTAVEIRVPISGSLVARQEALVYPRISGQEITEILVETGDTVRKGQILARLSDETMKSQLSSVEAEAERARASVGQAQSQIDSAVAGALQAKLALDRTQSLRRGGTAAQASLDQAIASDAAARAAEASARDGLAVARAATAQAQAAIDLAKLNVSRTEIASPADGVVSGRSAQLGAIGGASPEPMFSIIVDGEIEWQAEVVETALDQLSVGDLAIASVAGVGTVEGQVRLMPATVNPLTRLGEMRVSLNGSPKLRTGLFASGWAIVDRHDGLTVPLTAVLSSVSGDVVQVVRDGRIETRDVTAGAIWQGRREILAGVQAGDQVVIRAGAFFREGDRIDAIAEITDASQNPDVDVMGAAQSPDKTVQDTSAQPQKTAGGDAR